MSYIKTNLTNNEKLKYHSRISLKPILINYFALIIIGFFAGYGITDSPTNLTDLGGIASPSGADKLLASTGTPNTYAWQTTLNGISITAAGTIQFANGTSINEFSTDTTLSGNSDDAVQFTNMSVKASSNSQQA